MEPEEFEGQLRSIAPTRPVIKRPSQEEMYEAWQAEMSIA
jgi:hypothetical protein